MSVRHSLAHRLAPWLGIAFIVIVLDQATKIAMERLLAFGERVRVLPFFDFTLLYNKGAAFSFLADQSGWQRVFFTVIGLGATAFIVWLLARREHPRLFCWALALILGGAIGNVIDRLAYGHVIDFLLFYWQRFYWPAFNIADSAIVVGAALLVLDEFVRKRAPQSTPPTQRLVD
ncbi:MAG TPA: signal peptidase II [Burkholderiaceae bacterium]|nr:signal peptidase II [Burkholderiaceae bacterium]